MSPADLLRQAAERITPETWMQGDLGSGDVGVWPWRRCALGHLTAVCGPEPCDTLHAAVAALERVIGTGHIARWNDRPGQTAAGVREAFLRAAAGAR